ncbi:MAG: hypothetical protein WBE41_07510, partial [Terracidiphilus sp.]
MALEDRFRLHLAQARSNGAAHGKETDFKVAERLVCRYRAEELTLSFVPDAEQRLKRTLTRRRTQQMRDRVRIQNQVESLLEETRRFRRDQRSPETVARPTRRNRHVHQFHSGAGFIREPEKLVGICSSTPHAQPISKSISAISTAPGEPSNSPGRGFHRARVSGQCDRCDRRRRG